MMRMMMMLLVLPCLVGCGQAGAQQVPIQPELVVSEKTTGDGADTATALCPKGQVISGGCECVGNGVMAASIPGYDRQGQTNGWNCRCSGGNAVAYALCAEGVGLKVGTTRRQ